jgi:cysteinyl-tRNA synthetase
MKMAKTGTCLQVGNPGDGLERQPTGLAYRLLVMHTHYRKPMNFTQDRLNECGEILVKWLDCAEPCDDPVPQEIVEALSNDLNTPEVIKIMHKFCKKKRGRELYASMRILGFLN